MNTEEVGSFRKGNPVPDAYVFFVFLHVNGETSISRWFYPTAE
jgi:hypothetical protein